MRSLLVVLMGFLASPLAAAESLATVAEKSDFKATSRHADVVAFCEELARRSPLVKLSSFGSSREGRKLPLLVLADPPVSSPEEAARSKKLVVLAFANIHAGEVDGKEALLALARDLALKKSPLLKDLVILLVPILNADGNERIDRRHRPEQKGPAEGVGIRENAQGFDLNRDFVKLETPEIRALVKLFNAWDPAVIVDCHTTNGSKHRFTLTYDGPRYPDSDSALCSWVDGTFLPEAGRRVKRAVGYDTAPYGNFSRDRTRWETYPATPRYSTQYIALRNRIGILSESYTYAPFKDRVLASGAFVKACFEIASERQAEVKKRIAMPVLDRIAVRTETVAFPRKQTILGFADGQPEDYQLDYMGRVRPVEMVRGPAAYLIPANHTAAIDALRRHGVKVEELREDIELEVEASRIQAVEASDAPVQKRRLLTIRVKPRMETRMIRAGTFVVNAKQPLGSLAAYLLEAHAEDGFAAWGLLGSELRPGTDYPIVRLSKLPPTILTGAPRPLPEDRTMNRPITEAMLFGGRGRGFTFGLAGNVSAAPQWLPDGEHFLQTRGGTLWKVAARTGLATPFIDAELLKKSLAALPELKGAAEALSKRPPSRMNPDRTGMLVETGGIRGDGILAIAYFDGRPAVKLDKRELSHQHLSFSPQGDRIAFIRDNNLYSIGVAGPRWKKLTTDGEPDIINGKGDWVYEEEIFNRAGRAYWWSPDGSQIAYLRFNDLRVNKFDIVDLQPTLGRLESYRYPKAGDNNPLVSLHVVSADGGKPIALDLGEYDRKNMVISRVGWFPDSKRVFAFVQNRTQTWLDFVVWDGPSMKPRKLFRDSTKAWIDDPGEPRFLRDGTFLFPSERTGYKHLYRYTADGKLLNPVTTGNWEVRDVLRIDENPSRVYFTATKDGATRLNLYRSDLSGGEPERLTAVGNHRISLAPRGPLFLDTFTDDATPNQLYLCEAGKGRIRTLDSNPVYAREEYRFGKFEAVTVPMPDGFPLSGTLVYPPDFDPKKKYPIWLFTYAGPHTPTVREGWGGGRILDQALASSGIIAFHVDPRSASGQSAAAAWTAYKQLGVQELKDLEAAVAWLCKNPWADSNRVGISGHSYGGFMAAYALTHSKAFSAGIASSAVTDWRLYDSIYTERYMLTPKENPQGYDKSSVVKAAKNLHGRLLIIHGMIDDNVHLQNSVQLVTALQAAGKSFEMMFYPQSRHGIGSQHYLRLEIDFIRRTLGVKP